MSGLGQISEKSDFMKALAPANGLVVIDPATSRALPEGGAIVQGNAEYWIRRQNEGDVHDVSTTSEDTEVNKS